MWVPSCVCSNLQLQETVTNGLQSVQTVATNAIPDAQAALAGLPSAMSTLATAIPDAMGSSAAAAPATR
jgi:hypothetical protein